MTLSAEQKAFENYWRLRHPARDFSRRKWLKRSDVWGDLGYELPSVHFEWLAWKNGAAWQRTQKVRRS